MVTSYYLWFHLQADPDACVLSSPVNGVCGQPMAAPHSASSFVCTVAVDMSQFKPGVHSLIIIRAVTFDALHPDYELGLECVINSQLTPMFCRPLILPVVYAAYCNIQWGTLVTHTQYDIKIVDDASYCNSGECIWHDCDKTTCANTARPPNKQKFCCILWLSD